VLEGILSKNGVLIRLTDERWTHITEEHCELAGLRLVVIETIGDPSRILAGREGKLLAVQEISIGKHLVVRFIKRFTIKNIYGIVPSKTMEGLCQVKAEDQN